MRQIILDTETTGLKVEEGHRLIEIGCIEMIDRKLTGVQFHKYINPEREVDAGAFAVHGISTASLQDKPLFRDIAKELMDFVAGDELIIHNAPFDLSFINHELLMTRQGWKTMTEYCSVIDTLQMARKLHAGQKNSLDALCKRYFVDNSRRDLHGAIIDCHLLAQVYLAMTGGQGSFFDAPSASHEKQKKSEDVTASIMLQKHNLTVLKADAAELQEHEKYLALLQKKGKCVWTKE